VIDDQLILSSLIGQVTKAARGRSEREVKTFITRPFWNLWCKATNIPENSVPTDWTTVNCIRIYGSETIVVESEKFAAVSY
jgi:hypothetical protein